MTAIRRSADAKAAAIGVASPSRGERSPHPVCRATARAADHRPRPSQTKNAAALRRKLAPFIDHARKAGRGQRRRPGPTAASRDRSGDIRAWAKDHGIAVSERGRIPASVVEQYHTASKGH